MEIYVMNLHQEAKVKALHYRQAETALLDILIRLDEHKVFVALGYPSLFEYCLRELGLSEANTCNFIAVARKSREIPELKAEIAAGNLSVSKARKITPVLTSDNATLWLDKAKSLTHKDLEREVARERPEVLVHVGARYISEDRLALQLGVSEALMEQLAQLQNLLSQKKKEPVALEKALEMVVGEYLERHDPVQRAKRAIDRDEKKQAKEQNANSSVARQTQEEDKFDDAWLVREGIRDFVKHQVMHRDRGQCAFVYPNGRRCKEQRFLEMHHIRPQSEGGPHTLENLTLLCSAHHKHTHLKMNHRRLNAHPMAIQGRLGFALFS